MQVVTTSGYGMMQTIIVGIQEGIAADTAQYQQLDIERRTLRDLVRPRNGINAEEFQQLRTAIGNADIPTIFRLGIVGQVSTALWRRANAFDSLVYGLSRRLYVHGVLTAQMQQIESLLAAMATECDGPTLVQRLISMQLGDVIECVCDSNVHTHDPSQSLYRFDLMAWELVAANYPLSIAMSALAEASDAGCSQSKLWLEFFQGPRPTWQPPME